MDPRPISHAPMIRFTRRRRSARLSLRGSLVRAAAHGYPPAPGIGDIREGVLDPSPVGRTVRPERLAAPDEVPSGRLGSVRRVTGQRSRAYACERNGCIPPKETGSVLGRCRDSFGSADRTWEIDAFRAGLVPQGIETVLPARIRRTNLQSRAPDRYPARTGLWLPSKFNTA